MNNVDNRIEIANEILFVISEHGRKFFDHKGEKSKFVITGDKRKTLKFYDSFSKKEVNINLNSSWKGFTNGGTLKALCENLRDYIKYNKKIRNHFGPWPDYLCDGDLWGYGDEMNIVRDKINILIKV